MLSTSKPSCLGVFDVDVHCSSLLQSVLWENQIRAQQIDELIGMEHTREAQCHQRSKTAPPPKQGQANDGPDEWS